MMPLPGHIHEEKMIEMIHPDKDMDGLTTVNAGRLFSGKDGLFGGTPRAVMAILKHYGISVEGKHAVIIGRSNVIGKPVAMMLMQKCYCDNLPFTDKEPVRDNTAGRYTCYGCRESGLCHCRYG